MKRCIVGIRRPGEQDAPTGQEDAPAVYFPSMATMAAVLSEDRVFTQPAQEGLC